MLQAEKHKERIRVLERHVRTLYLDSISRGPNPGALNEARAEAEGLLED